MIKLSQLAIYPIKSTAQISLTHAQLSAFGLDMDRRWMLIDKQGIMLTQRKHPKMCLIQCAIKDSELRVSAPNMPDLKIHIKPSKDLIKASVWEDTCDAYDCGNTAAEWFSLFLNISAQLVYFPEGEIRQVDLNYAEQGDITAFSDGFPYLLISQASLNDLNNRLDSPVDMKRFRPNFVVEGTEPFAEDTWQQIRIGDTVFDLVKPCSRCSIPSINPDTAVQTADVVKTLASYRLRKNKIFFGQNLIARGNGKLQVGMHLEVLKYK